jgi:hypothetical protein
MGNEQLAPLTAAEQGMLWSAYMENSMMLHVMKHFAKKAEDREIRPHVEFAYQLADQFLKKSAHIITEAHMSVPNAFTENDVNDEAPRLFSDSFVLFYVSLTAKKGLDGMTIAVSNASRKDIVGLFSESISGLLQLHNFVHDTLISKGLHVRPPVIPVTETSDFVKRQSFLTGYFGERRPLTSLEITCLYQNIQRNVLGKGLMIGFAQVAKQKNIKQMMLRGKEMADKHIEIYSSLITESDLSAPMAWDVMPTRSTEAPFSDKLMLFHLISLIPMSISFYGRGIAYSTRTDLITHYTRLMAEIVKYAEDALNLMIHKGWLEQPPTAPDRKEIIFQR